MDKKKVHSEISFQELKIKFTNYRIKSTAFMHLLVLLHFFGSCLLLYPSPFKFSAHDWDVKNIFMNALHL